MAITANTISGNNHCISLKCNYRPVAFVKLRLEECDSYYKLYCDLNRYYVAMLHFIKSYVLHGLFKRKTQANNQNANEESIQFVKFRMTPLF